MSVSSKDIFLHALGLIAGGILVSFSVLRLASLFDFYNSFFAAYAILFGIATISIELVKLDFFVKQFGFLFTNLGRGMFYLFISFFAVGSDGWTCYIGPVFLVFLGFMYIIGYCTDSALPPPLINTQNKN